MARSRNNQRSQKCHGEVRDILRRRAMRAPQVEFDPEEISLVPELVPEKRRSICSWIFAHGQKIVVEFLDETATAHVRLVT